MRYYLLIILFFYETTAHTQNLSYYNNIHKIINEKCSSCHKVNGNTPFVLDSYESVATRIQTILKVVSDNIMPPFPADTSYVKYYNQNVLTLHEKINIQNWVLNGMKKGKTPSNKHQNKNKYKKNEEIKIPLLSNVSVKQQNEDVYIYKILDWQTDQTVLVNDYYFDIKSPFLHHAEILSLDSNYNTYHLADSLLITNLYESKYFKLDKYLFGWFPGSSCGIFPNGAHMKLEAKKSYLLVLHYISTNQEFVDSSRLLLYLNKYQQSSRAIHEFAIHGTYRFLSENNRAVFIPANTIQTFHYSKTVTSDLSVFAAYGHAHHLCKNMMAYAVTPNNDTIPLLKINDWKFNWQLTYRFEKYKKIPQGSVVHFFATYDNTINNPENMHNPPKDVYASFMADDEMMEFFMMYVDYQYGDEFNKIQYQDSQKK